MVNQSRSASIDPQGSQLRELQPGSWQLSGDIDFHSVVALRQAGIVALGQVDGHCQFDFSQVGSVDSMTLSLMLCWSRAASRAGVELQFSGIPPELHAIAEVSDLLPLLLAER